VGHSGFLHACLLRAAAHGGGLPGMHWDFSYPAGCWRLAEVLPDIVCLLWRRRGGGGGGAGGGRPPPGAAPRAGVRGARRGCAPMQIFVAMPGGRVLALEVEDSIQVAALKEQVQLATASIPPERQRLMHGNKIGGEPHWLDDTRTLREYNIEREATLQLAVMPPPMVVELNVGGERHTTLLSTLCRVQGSSGPLRHSTICEGAAALAG
jgi:hypothetical protein